MLRDQTVCKKNRAYVSFFRRPLMGGVGREQNIPCAGSIRWGSESHIDVVAERRAVSFNAIRIPPRAVPRTPLVDSFVRRARREVTSGKRFSALSMAGTRRIQRDPGQPVFRPNRHLRRIDFRLIERTDGHVDPLAIFVILEEERRPAAGGKRTLR